MRSIPFGRLYRVCRGRHGSATLDGSRITLRHYLVKSVQVCSACYGIRFPFLIYIVIVAHLSKLKKDASRRQSKLDTAKRRQRQYNVFEAIKRSQKKREESQRMSGMFMDGIYRNLDAEIIHDVVSAPMPRSTIETHGMSSSGQRLPTAMELSLAKAQRDRHVAQMLMDHRHFSMQVGGLLPEIFEDILSNQALAQGLPHQGHSAAAPQARPPTAPLVSNNQPSLLNGTPTASTTARPPPAQPSPSTQIPSAPVPGIPINRYPAAQLQLLRQQQQLALLAMAQAQSQGQAAPGPTGSPHMQRFPGGELIIGK